MATVAPRQDPPPACAGAADALLIRRLVDLARRGKEAHVGLAELERVEAVRRLAGPSRAQADAVSRGIEQFVESLDLIRLEP